MFKERSPKACTETDPGFKYNTGIPKAHSLKACNKTDTNLKHHLSILKEQTPKAFRRNITTGIPTFTPITNRRE